MRITGVTAHHMIDIPIEPPPHREVPNRTSEVLVEVTTDEGITGWGMAGYAHEIVVSFINDFLGPAMEGEDALRTEWFRLDLRQKFKERRIGTLFTSALSTIDIALWDIKGKAFGQPVHMLLGGARDRVPVYITHGAAYGDDPRYTVEELVAEAQELVAMGNRHLKNVVGRQAIPDPDDDYERMSALREAVGPNVKLAMDGNTFMSLSEALKLCRLCEDLDIAFLEEPLYHNNPDLLNQLRSQTAIPIAAAQNPWVSARELLMKEAVDIIQPNVNQDQGYSGALQVAELADAFDVPLGHGNGGGPHNVAFQCGVRNGAIVEYHYHRWKAYAAIFENAPEPNDGFLVASPRPGLDLDPREGLVAEYAGR